MNLRDKFLWNMSISLCILAAAWNLWNLYNMNYDSNKSLENFKNEQVGADEELEKKVEELEDIYLFRDAMKFVMYDNPVDLNKVISLDGKSSRGRKNFFVSGIYHSSYSENSPIALINIKDKEYKVIKGDSIAGGIILEISKTEVVFEKNEKIYTYNLSVNNNIE